jgi:hydrophobic/amphiphilic exporter-1 (mainly G- bacteria), HAE1 family
MPIIRFAIENPVKVAVGVILVVLFGMLSVFRIPIQLTPNVDRPIVTVFTSWQGAAAAEIEREIVHRQEEKLKTITGLWKMTSISREGSAQVTLEFLIGVTKDDSKREVSDALRQVTGYPVEMEEPVIQAGGTESQEAIAWLIFKGEPGRDVSTLYDYLDEKVKPILERVDGVASVQIYGGREREVQVRVDPYKLAARKITLTQLANALRAENKNTSAGTVEQGKRDYTFRTIGQYERVEQVENTVITYVDGGPVFVHDVATVVNDYKEPKSFVRSEGQDCLALPVNRETGSNVMQVMADLRETIGKINREILNPVGRGLELTQVYDETVYIQSAIDLVRSSLVEGSVLTILVLLVFLRSGSATFIVAVSIPISVIGTFLAVALLGRSLNVVMLAGMAFAVGMVVDDAIVVIENIFRHRQMGESRFDAALHGTVEVWGAVLASTLTTMAVFVPVVFVKEEAGQLFRDIAIAISCGVGLSLPVSVLVIPPLCRRVLFAKADSGLGEHAAGRIANGIADIGHRINQSVWARLATGVGMTALSALGAWYFIPPTDYLPSGNRNLIFGFLIPPPGYGLDEFRRVGRVLEEPDPPQAPLGLRQYWEAQNNPAAAAALPTVQMTTAGGSVPGGPPRQVAVRPPPIANFFYGAFEGRGFMGCTSKNPTVVKPLLEVFREAAGRVTGMIPFFFQSSLFGGETGGNTIEIEIRGTELADVIRVASLVFAKCMETYPGAVQPDPGNFALPRHEIQAIPDRVRAANVGLTVREVGFTLQTFVDGAYIGGFRQEGDEIDLTLMLDRPVAATREELGGYPIYTPSGRVVPLDSAVELRRGTGPEEIKHIEEMPAVSLTVRAPEGEALGTVMERIRNEIIGPLLKSGAVPHTVLPPQLAGNADKLLQTFNAIKWNLLLALLITYLLMAALFESFVYPLVILFSLPPATVGGFVTLALVHYVSARNPLVPTQQLDVVTMLGFIILIGVVVKNAILIVHQALNNMRHRGMEPNAAVRESVRTRVRPIFMTSLTTVFGMLPLVVAPGAGSELYRGLGAVVLGGLLVSTLFTLFMVPAMFSLAIGIRSGVIGWIRRPAARPAAPRGAVTASSESA